MTDRRSFLLGSFAVSLAGCSYAPAAPIMASQKAQALIAAARRQIGVTLAYDPGYSRLTYPGGDVDRAKGVCTDVVIRAYPKRWGLRSPDRNIDHRRVPNLERFWQRQGAQLVASTNGADWQPGDIFTSLYQGQLPHTGIVSDRRGESGAPMILHNIGSGTKEQDMLFSQRLNGRFRWRV